MFQIRYDECDEVSGFFATRELAQQVLEEMIKTDMCFGGEYIVEVEVVKDYTSWCEKNYRGCRTLADFCAYRDSNYEVKPSYLV